MALDAPYPFGGDFVKETPTFPLFAPQSSVRENSRVFQFILNHSNFAIITDLPLHCFGHKLIVLAPI